MIFLAVWTVVLVAPVVGVELGSDAVVWPVVIAACVLAGALACDWRMVLLALAVIPLGWLQYCDPETTTESCEINALGYAAVFVAPFAAILLAIGVLLGKAIRRRSLRNTA
ncbi:MAG TPA: hypothetical protein VGR11_11720 [Solirubrobacteraceae bacterium]|nr:hypothetical protein [Solirubrobacteraceae bacterium]